MCSPGGTQSISEDDTGRWSNRIVFFRSQNRGAFQSTNCQAFALHPPKQTWNLKMDPWKRRFLLETTISRFHVNFWGCICIYMICICVDTAAPFSELRHMLGVWCRPRGINQWEGACSWRVVRSVSHTMKTLLDPKWAYKQLFSVRKCSPLIIVNLQPPNYVTYVTWRCRNGELRDEFLNSKGGFFDFANFQIPSSFFSGRHCWLHFLSGSDFTADHQFL